MAEWVCMTWQFADPWWFIYAPGSLGADTSKMTLTAVVNTWKNLPVGALPIDIF